MHNIFRDYEIKTDPLIPARRPDLVLIKSTITNIIFFRVKLIVISFLETVAGVLEKKSVKK